jgi:hypothetical protein
MKFLKDISEVDFTSHVLSVQKNILIFLMELSDSMRISFLENWLLE